MMKNQRILSFGFAFVLFITVSFAQNRDSIKRLVRNEMRIKLPSDIAFSHDSNGVIEGEHCYNLVRRINGICLLPNQCPEAILDFRKGIQPQICNYKGHIPIICCPRAVQTTTRPAVQQFFTSASTTTSRYSYQTTTRAPIPSTTAFRPQINENFQKPRISEQKCTDYVKLVTEQSVVTTLSLANSENRTVESTKCVKAASEGFVVGGTKTEAGEFTHMAAIGWPEEDGLRINWNCGGSLISYRFVLSAAHCVSQRGVRPKIIRLGDQNLKRTDDGGEIQDFAIDQFLRHPNYRGSSKYNDIALFQLDRNIRITDFVRPACLWQSFTVDYTNAIATGWGLTRDRGKPSDDLLKVSLNIITNDRCNTFYERSSALKDGIIDSQFCAGDDVEEKDTCNGDSGGPIQIAAPKSACTYYVIGVTSFGKGCGNSYGVYTRVSHFLDWIESIAWNYE